MGNLCGFQFAIRAHLKRDSVFGGKKSFLFANCQFPIAAYFVYDCAWLCACYLVWVHVQRMWPSDLKQQISITKMQNTEQTTKQECHSLCACNRLFTARVQGKSIFHSILYTRHVHYSYNIFHTLRSGMESTRRILGKFREKKRIMQMNLIYSSYTRMQSACTFLLIRLQIPSIQ